MLEAAERLRVSLDRLENQVVELFEALDHGRVVGRRRGRAAGQPRIQCVVGLGQPGEAGVGCVGLLTGAGP